MSGPAGPWSMTVIAHSFLTCRVPDRKRSALVLVVRSTYQISNLTTRFSSLHSARQQLSTRILASKPWLGEAHYRLRSLQ